MVTDTAPATLEEAYAACQRMARGHYENFPVASWLLPREARPHIAAIYAFARTADDFADEGSLPAATRLANLADWRFRLREVIAGRPPTGRSDSDLAFIALGETMRVCELESAFFEDLLSAFRQDVAVARYATWTELLDYCKRSANPIGRLVLRVVGYREAHLDEASDAMCTALQLTNFWQDLERDWMAGRLYVPGEICQDHGADPRDFDGCRWTPEWAAALADAGARTRALFEAGRPVADGVRGRLRWELRATWLGGMRILERLERVKYDVFQSRPQLGRSDLVVIGSRALLWRKRASIQAPV